MLKKKNMFVQKNPFFFINIIFEAGEFTFYKNPNLQKNSYYIHTDCFNVIKTIKFFSEAKPVSLTDIVSFDATYLSNLDRDYSDKISVFYHMYSYKMGHYAYVNLDARYLETVEDFFSNSCWLEREQKEFFGLKFRNMRDSRNLLLEYDWDKNIFLKKYHVSDNYDILYDKDDDDHLTFSKLKSFGI